MKLDIFKKTKHIDPNYQHLLQYGLVIWKGFWTPAKYQKNIEKQDAPYVLNKMDAINSTVVKRCVLAISIVEDKVKTFWGTLFLDIPQTIIGEVGAIFGSSEVTHSQSYRALAEALGLQEGFENIMKEPVLRGRVNYLQKYLNISEEDTHKSRTLKKLVLFTALVERASLFSQFYILMSYANSNKGLKTIASLQSSTATEEILHYSFGIELINIIKEQNPGIWDEALERLVTKDLKAAHKSEIALIDWIFERGVPSHLSKEEVINFLNFNFNTICTDLSINLAFPFEEDLYEDKNSWMMNSLKPSEPDFFVTPVGGYSSIKEELSDEDIEDIFNC